MRYRFWIGVILSVALVVFMLQRVDVQQITSLLVDLRMIPLLLAVATLLLTLVIKAWRWHYLMESIKPVPVSYLWSATSIGAMIDMVLPARTGDIVRAYLVGRKAEVSKMASLATIVVEKLLDILVILLIAVPMLALVSFPGSEPALVQGFRTGIYAAGAICTAIFIGLFVMRRRPIRSEGAINRYLRFLPAGTRARLADVVDNFGVGMQTIRTVEHLSSTLVLSLALWLTYAVSNYFVLQSFDLDLPMYASFLFVVFQVLGVTLPSSPGFIGTYHAAVVVGFALLGVSQDVALSVAIVMHAAFFFPFIALGFILVWRENLSIRTLSELEADPQ